jgi:hypothetical protein
MPASPASQMALAIINCKWTASTSNFWSDLEAQAVISFAAFGTLLIDVHDEDYCNHRVVRSFRDR